MSGETTVVIFCMYFLFSHVIYVTSSATLVKAPCPAYQVVQNFDLVKFCSDQWYQIARYPDDFENKGDCVTLRFSFGNNICQFAVSEISEGKENVISGNVTFLNSETSGALSMKSSSVKDEEVNNSFPFKILAIDYNNFFLVYECRYNETTQMRHEYVWIYARTRKLKDEVDRKLKELYKTADSFIDTNKFIWEHYSDEACKINV